MLIFCKFTTFALNVLLMKMEGNTSFKYFKLGCPNLLCHNKSSLFHYSLKDDLVYLYQLSQSSMVPQTPKHCQLFFLMKGPERSIKTERD